MFEDAASSPVGDLMAASQRLKTASELNTAILTKYNQEQEPRLQTLMKMLLWSQDQLAEKATFPKMIDLSTGQLADIE